MMTRRRIFSAVLFQIHICFSAGLYLYPAADLTGQSFTLVCDLQGASLANAISFKYNITSAGVCSSPPNSSCFSLIGTITPGTNTVNFTLNKNEISSKGNALWTCSHGSVSDSYNAVVISYCQNKKVEYEDEKIVLSCSCGFPYARADIEYKDGGKILGKEELNLTSSVASCLSDARAMDFLADISNFPPDTTEACATIKSSDNEATNPICTVVGCGTDGELFMCGFSLFLIELAVFTVIMILLKLKKMGGFTKVKIVVSCVFLLVALIIGIILGVVLMECSKKNLSLGLGIGLGCMLASAHFVTIYVIHKKNDSKKDDKDKERQGTPVSTSNVKVTSEKAPSHGNPASKNGNVIVSLPNEPIRPLPVPPATRKNQLEPLSVENDGATSPEKKKKKKKKKKRKNTESTDAPEES